MKLINLTPHTINFVSEDGTPVLAVNPSGQIARVTAKTVTTGMVDVTKDMFTIFAEVFSALDEETGECVVIPTTGTTYGEVEGLPAPEDGTIYIVSSLVASRVPDRADVFIPNESVRDAAGRIVGCKSLGHI